MDNWTFRISQIDNSVWRKYWRWIKINNDVVEDDFHGFNEHILSIVYTFYVLYTIEVTSEESVLLKKSDFAENVSIIYMKID